MNRCHYEKWIWLKIWESCCKLGIEPSGFISHRVSYTPQTITRIDLGIAAEGVFVHCQCDCLACRPCSGSVQSKKWISAFIRLQVSGTEFPSC